jgi:hypothetical protein
MLKIEESKSFKNCWSLQSVAHKRFWPENLKGRGHLTVLRIDRRIILERILGKYVAQNRQYITKYASEVHYILVCGLKQKLYDSHTW